MGVAGSVDDVGRAQRRSHDLTNRELFDLKLRAEKSVDTIIEFFGQDPPYFGDAEAHKVNTLLGYFAPKVRYGIGQETLPVASGDGYACIFAFNGWWRGLESVSIETRAICVDVMSGGLKVVLTQAHHCKWGTSEWDPLTVDHHMTLDDAGNIAEWRMAFDTSAVSRGKMSVASALEHYNPRASKEGLPESLKLLALASKEPANQPAARKRLGRGRRSLRTPDPTPLVQPDRPRLGPDGKPYRATRRRSIC